MKLLMFSIHDSKANSFITPFFSPTEGVAKRSVKHAVNSPDTDFGRFPADYTLFHVGYFETDQGEAIKIKPIIEMGNLLTYKNQEED